jgi:hypothetical protein
MPGITIFYCIFTSTISCCPVFNLGWKNILIEYFIIHTIEKHAQFWWKDWEGGGLNSHFHFQLFSLLLTLKGV